jgi:transposase
MSAHVTVIWPIPLTWRFTRLYRQEEIPAAPAERVQHDLHEVHCACGRPNVAARRQLITDVVGAAASDGFIHSCQAKAASLAVDVVALIRTLITATPVAGFDETTPRSRSAGVKKYVHSAFTEEYSAFWLGANSLDSMEDAGILPGFAGIVVSERYQNYFSHRWQHIIGNQACIAHLLRDFEDCAWSYPDAIRPAQAQRALRGMT